MISHSAFFARSARIASSFSLPIHPCLSRNAPIRSSCSNNGRAYARQSISSMVKSFRSSGSSSLIRVIILVDGLLGMFRRITTFSRSVCSCSIAGILLTTRLPCPSIHIASSLSLSASRVLFSRVVGALGDFGSSSLFYSKALGLLSFGDALLLRGVSKPRFPESPGREILRALAPRR